MSGLAAISQAVFWLTKSSTETARSGSEFSFFQGVLPGQSPRDRAARGALAFLFAAAIYWLCLRFLFPGYFAPLTPNHSDLYTPVGFLERSFSEILTYPRPLTYVILRTSGLLGVQGSILVVVLAAIVAVLLASTMTVRWARARMSLLGLACYLILVFGHPEFYFEHRHDSPGVFSCALVILAAEFWRRWLIENRWRQLGGCFALTLALGLVKETYFPSLLILLVTLVVAEQQWRFKRIVPALAGVCALLGLSFLISAAGFRRWIPAGAESYHISLAPPEVWGGFVYYLSHLFTWGTALALFVSLALLVRNRRKLVISSGMTLAGIAALLPNSVLPNHLSEQYSWLAVPFCFAPLLLLAAPERDEALEPEPGGSGSFARRRRLAGLVVVFLTALSVWRYFPEYASTVHQWGIAQELENRGIMASFAQLRRLPPGGRVLVAGVDTPLNPWIEPDFLKHEFGPHEWTVVIAVDRPDTELPPDHPSVHLRHAAEVNPDLFDHAFVYDGKGNLRQEYDQAALVVAARSQPEAIVVPELAPLVDRLRQAPDDHMALLRAGELCLNWGLDQQAEGYLRRSVEVTHDHDPYAFFFLGELKERQHDLAAAYTDYQRAVETDQEPRNPVFQQAAERARAARH
jgi:hypothetical protein